MCGIWRRILKLSWAGLKSANVPAVPCGDSVVSILLPVVETTGYYEPSRFAGLEFQLHSVLLPLLAGS